MGDFKRVKYIVMFIYLGIFNFFRWKVLYKNIKKCLYLNVKMNLKILFKSLR